jgi:hypothetical protein
LKIKGIFLGPSVFLLQNPFKLYGFLTFQFWAYMMKVILSIYDEGYFEHIWWRLFWAYMMKVILSIYYEGYFRSMSSTLNLLLHFYSISVGYLIFSWVEHSRTRVKDVEFLTQVEDILIFN